MSTLPVLVVNTGSTSLRLAVVDGDEVVAAERLAPPDDPADALADFLRDAPAPAAAGHRIVHGGVALREPALVDERLEGMIDELAELASLHNPCALAAIRALRRQRPELPAVACFDTAFHANLPEAAATYRIPASWRERWPLRRFGFHGLSHSWVARRAAALLGDPRDRLRIVSCHLGAGASIAAIAGGRSVDTTMGFTPLDGENSARVRAETLAPLGFLGIELDREANETATPDAIVSTPTAAVAAAIIASREDLEIARETRSALADAAT